MCVEGWGWGEADKETSGGEEMSADFKIELGTDE